MVPLHILSEVVYTVKCFLSEIEDKLTFILQLGALFAFIFKYYLSGFEKKLYTLQMLFLVSEQQPFDIRGQGGMIT